MIFKLVTAFSLGVVVVAVITMSADRAIQPTRLDSATAPQVEQVPNAPAAPTEQPSVAELPQTKPEKLEWIYAPALQAQYSSNEVAADAALKHRRIGVIATVESINKDFFDQPYLCLEAGADSFEKPQASFSSDHLSELAQLRKGQQVSLSCVVNGLMVGSVMLEKCEFADAPQVGPSAPAPHQDSEPSASPSTPDTPTATQVSY